MPSQLPVLPEWTWNPALQGNWRDILGRAEWAARVLNGQEFNNPQVRDFVLRFCPNAAGLYGFGMEPERLAIQLRLVVMNIRQTVIVSAP